MILFLDDNSYRHSHFQALVGRPVVDHVYTASEAITALSARKYDAVFLDHDLGFGHSIGMYDSSAPDGWVVTEFIRDQNIQIPLLVIHSMNPDGAKRMQSHYPTAILAMFGTDLFNIIVGNL